MIVQQMEAREYVKNIKSFGLQKDNKIMYKYNWTLPLGFRDKVIGITFVYISKFWSTEHVRVLVDQHIV